MKTRNLVLGVLGVVALAGCGSATASVNATPKATPAASVPSSTAKPRPPAKTPAPTTAKPRPPAKTPAPTTAKPRSPAAPPKAPTPTTAAPTTLAPTVAPTVVVTQVIDGDTIVIDTGQHVRFIGIDTPERDHCGYDAATANMRRLVYGKAVILTAGARDDVDRYGRLLRYIDLPDGTDTGLAQIRGGFAVARYDSRDGYGHHPREETYIAADTGAAAPCVYGTAASPGSSVYYRNCAAARAAGAAPLHRGDPGYRSALDGDHDGVACE
jgi:endonuclease YncB( thermonuclease family)